MRQYTFTENGFTFERVDKKQARKAYNNGLTVRFCPCNLRPGSPFRLDMDMNRAQENCAGVDFKKLLNAFEFYNCTNTETGRYTAFYIPVALDSWQDRRDANKEITEIKRFLIECAGLGLVECFPGWCTGYSDYNGTITAIRAAVKEMRDELRTIPTWTQYNRAC